MRKCLSEIWQQIYETLPKGYISVKNISGKERLYYQWRDDKKIRSRYIKKGDYEELAAQIAHRKDIKAEIEKVKAMDHRLAAYARKFYLGKPVPIGEQSYAQLIVNKLFYVDKTRFIQEWWSSQDRVTLITRPRRFGKTLTMSMLECFFSIRYANREDLFEGLYIWSKPDYRALQGKYPVVSISFSSVKNVQHFEEDLQFLIKEQFFGHEYLLASEVLDVRDKELFDRIYLAKEMVSFGDAIRTLCMLLEKHWGHKVILLIDEYDTPLHEAYAAGKWDEICNEMRAIFNTILKSNSHLEKALLTGITRVGRESMFSDLNHLRVVSVTDRKYETAFGFTEGEVFEALQEQGMGDDKTRQKVKEWYDGFTFGKKSDIYNPWSIVNFLSDKELKPYWSNSGSHLLLGKLLGKGDRSVKEKLEKLLQGESVAIELHTDLNFGLLEKDERAIWNLMLAAGYLKPTAEATMERNYSVKSASGEWIAVKVTNYEAMLAFSKTFVAIKTIAALDMVEDQLDEVVSFSLALKEQIPP